MVYAPAITQKPVHAKRQSKPKAVAAAPGGAAPLPADKASSMDMARQVLRNHGAPMKYEQLEEAIYQEYGKHPAKTLVQMLYKRSRKGKGFLKTADGAFGLVEQPIPSQVTFEEVVVPLTATA